MSEKSLYHELLRPQFHFTAEKNWLNDPNGLVYYQGEYHMFFQYNEKGLKWGPNTWGHAVSSDLIHWKQLDHAIRPDDQFGWIWSGSAVVDWHNTSGLGIGEEPPLVAIYTTGDTRSVPRKECVQCVAYSNDQGRTWTKYQGNPVLGHIVEENRDPKVIRHEPSKSWIMVLYLEKNKFTFFRSPDLLHWTRLHDLEMPGATECPDFFELPVAGGTKWVFWGGDGAYFIGSFDGRRFIPETDVLWSESGANGYAAQSWSDIPDSDGRRIQISWMRNGKYPYMPFNQQMSFPVELELCLFPEGIRMCRKPVKEIELLHDKTFSWQNIEIDSGTNFIPEIPGDIFHIRAGIKTGNADHLGFLVHGIDLQYNPQKKSLTCLGKEMPVEIMNGMLELELLVDRTSLELFSQGGKYSASFCFLPEASDSPLEIYSRGTDAKIASLTIHSLQSAW